MSGRQITAIAVLVFILICATLFWVARSKVDKDITVAIVAAAGTILASVVVVSVTQYNTKQMEVAESHRLPKIEVYSEFGDLVFSIFQMIKIPSRDDLSDEEKQELLRDSQSELEGKYSSFSRKLLLWGSPEVIQGWLKFMANSRSIDSQPSEAQSTEAALRNLLFMDDVFRAMREDLELSNSGLEEGDLVKAFLTDPETLDPLIGRRR